MPLELKDLATQKTMIVPEEGLTFGREGGDANIQLRDTGVSKRHARVFGENGAWFLEDLGSSNGTWLQKERIKDATELLPGDVIQMSQVKYEVVQVTGADDAVEATSQQDANEPEDSGGAMDDEPVEEHEATPKPMPAAAKGKPLGAAKESPSAVKAKAIPAPAAPSKKMSKPPPPVESEASQAKKKSEAMSMAAAEAPADAGSGEPAKISVGYFLLTVPKAFAYYLAAMPILLVNPVGTIRKAVSEQKHEAKGRYELIAYALPAYLISAAFTFLGMLIVGIVTGTLSVGNIIPVGALIGALIGAGVTGFVWHPVLNWVVNFLKGQSDERSRTNLFMLYMTAFALLALPNFIALVLSLVHLPLIGLVPLVLRLAASLVMLFIFFSWFTAAGVVKWFRIVLMVLGGLACLSTLAGIPAAIAGSGGAGIASGGDSAAFEAKAEELRKQAEAQLAAAEKQGAAAQEQAEKAAAAAEDKAEAAVKAAPAEKAEKAEKAAPPPPAENAKAAPPPPEPAKAAPKPAEAAAAAVPTGGGYAPWHQKWDAIEKKISDDPTILNKNPQVLALYKQLEDQVFEADARYSKGKKASEKRVNEHLRDAELYEKTEAIVVELHQKLFGK
ncbi:MAG: FHA domain-containing protein [Archangiaceae bacterium]|nr:FHA domain-containing protein [Archangiaceae bacterium]